jgi:tol-pal system protein YbgF
MRKTRFLRPALAALALLLMASSALAQDQTFGEPLDKRLDRLEKQLREVRAIVLQAHATGAPVEIKESGPDPQVVALTSRLDDMEQTLRGMNGAVEGLQHDLAAARSDAADSKAQLAALSDRTDKLEKEFAALAPAPPPAAPDAQPGPSDGGLAGQAAQPQSAAGAPQLDAKAAYANARQLLLDGDYKAATAAFQDYVDRFGDTPGARPARYWLGETKFIQEDYTGAAAAYAGAIRGWPDTPWAPDAVVKLALSLVELNRTKDACGALHEFGRRYPHAADAAKARAEAARQKAGCAR